MKEKLKNMKGITLIALVITIIVLLILAGVSIAMLTGENGIITQAQKAKENTEQSAKNEVATLNSVEDYINEYTGQGNGYSKSKGVNSPKLVTGMHEVMFKLPEGTNKGQVIEKGQEGFLEDNWYDYQKSQWANAKTQDGSYWVWIPRYAYKITYKNPSNKSEGGSIDVKFLVGTTDQYYDDNGQLQTAKRATSATEAVDTTTNYYVHPAFTDESKINYANGGWDKELTGIWVAKFEAGFASGNNTAKVKASSVSYSQTTAWVAAVEAGTQQDSTQTARNWLDGEYAVRNSDGSYAWKNGQQTAIKYPTFQPKTYAMNYNNVNDAYNISKALTENGNIYGLNSNSTDSHLIKNSEWGAVAYLAQSQYGNKGTEPYINNITLNNSTKSVYAVTGVTTGTINASAKTTTIANINGTTGNAANGEIYTWDQIEGQKASSTLNMYGVYDMSGGTWERTAGYIANRNSNLKGYGASFTHDGDTLKTTSTKYATVYPHDSTKDNPELGLSWTEENINNAGKANYPQNKYIFGDAIRETSTSGTGTSSWNGDYSYFPGLYRPFVVRSGDCWNGANAGPFSFNRTLGNSTCDDSFRPVLVAL